MKILPALALLLLASAARADGFIEEPVDSQLQRELTPADRAWFGQPLLAAYQLLERGANAKGLGPCRMLDSQKHPVKSAKPEALILGAGAWSPGGLLQDLWSVAAECGDLTLWIHLGLDMESIRRAEGFVDGIAPPPVTEHGSDFLISEGEVMGTPIQEVLIGNVGDHLDYSPSTGTPARASPRVVAISRQSSGPDLKDLIDLAAVRALLASSETSPPLAVPNEPDTPAPPKDQLEAERTVIEFLLPPIDGFGRRRYVASARSNPVLLPIALSRTAPVRVSELLRSAVTDYVAKNVRPGLIPTGLKVPDAKVVVVKDMAATPRSFDSFCEGLKKYEALSGGGGLVRFSRVGLSRDLSQAIVYARIDHECPQREGAVYVLQRTGEEWAVLYVSRYVIEWPQPVSDE